MKKMELLRRIAFLPLAFLALVVISPIIALKVPSIVCGHLKKVRWLATIGISYYLFLGTITYAAVSLKSAIVVVFLGFLFADWLLPGPVSFIFLPRHRRAIYRIIIALEESGEIDPVYGLVRVIGSDDTRCIVQVEYFGVGTIRPLPRRFYSVSHDGDAIETLSFEYVHKQWGVQLRY